MKEIKLPSGNTVKLRSADTFKHKDRKQVLSSVNGEIGIATGIEILDNLIAVLIEEWSFDLLLPKIKKSSLDELTIADYDAIAQEAQEVQKQLFPKFSVDNGDPDNPKGN